MPRKNQPSAESKPELSADSKPLVASAALPLLLGVLELLALSATVDVGPSLAALGLAWLSLGHIAAGVGIAAAAVLLAAAKPVLRALAAGQKAQARFAFWLRVAVHGLGFLAVWATARRVFSPSSEVNLLWFSLWWAGAAVVVALGLSLLGPLTVARTLGPDRGRVLAGVAVGLVAALVGFAFQSLWGNLAGPTLWAAYALLSALGQRPFVDAQQMLLGIDDFVVLIAPACSGVEGMGLMAVFMAAYLGLYRRDLRSSTRVILLAASMALAWTSNTVRICLLVLVGRYVSADMAVSGFHAKAGAVLFCLLAWGLIYLLEGQRAASSEPAAPRSGAGSGPAGLDEEDPVPLLAPLLGVMATALVTGLIFHDFDYAYGLRIVVGMLLLWRLDAWRAVRGGAGIGWGPAPSLFSVGVGVLVFAFWIPLSGSLPAEARTQWVENLNAMDGLLRWVWIAVRALGSVVVVPVVEELAFRELLLRRLTAWPWLGPSPKLRTAFAVLASSCAFAVVHADLLAGFLAGLAYAGARLYRGQLMDAVFAHALTNALIAATAVGFGAWSLWI